MKTPLKLSVFGLLVVVPAMAFLPQAAIGSVVFDNTTGNLNTRFDASGDEIGDEVILDTSINDVAHHTITNFVFEFYGVNGANLPSFSGGEEAEVRFYANDGPQVSGYNSPGTLLFDSGPFAISGTSAGTLNFGGPDAFGAGTNSIVLPTDFTWSVTFLSLAEGESAGVDLYNPPAVGQDASDMWINSGGVWSLVTNNTVPLNFGAQFEAVPEPSSLALVVVGGLGTLAGLAMKRRSNATRG